MRPLLLVALAAACRAPDGPAVLPVDTDDADTAQCLRPLESSSPATWTELVTLAETACVRSWSCDDGGPVAHGVWFDECESSSEAYYGDDGALVATAFYSDVPVCPGGAWSGQVVEGCDAPDWRASVGCALPDDPTFVACPERLPGAAVGGPEVVTWDALAALADTLCFGSVTCPLADDAEVRVAFRYDLCGWEVFDVFDASGTRVGGGGTTGAAPCVDDEVLDEASRDALADCVGTRPSMPSTACGLAE